MHRGSRIMSCIEDRESCIEDRESCIEDRESDIEDQESCIEDQESCIEDRESAIDPRGSRIAFRYRILSTLAFHRCVCLTHNALRPMHTCYVTLTFRSALRLRSSLAS